MITHKKLTTVEQANELPVGTIILDSEGYAIQKTCIESTPTQTRHVWRNAKGGNSEYFGFQLTEGALDHAIVYLPEAGQASAGVLRSAFTEYDPYSAKVLNEELTERSVIMDAHGTVYVNKRPERIQCWKSIDDHRYYAAYELDFPIAVLHEAEAEAESDSETEE